MSTPARPVLATGRGLHRHERISMTSTRIYAPARLSRGTLTPMALRNQPHFTVVSLLLALGCSSEESAPDNGGRGGAPRGTGPGDWTAGDYPPSLKDPTYLEITGRDGQLGITRQYKVHVPPGYDRNVPTPVVFCLHG